MGLIDGSIQLLDMPGARSRSVRPGLLGPGGPAGVLAPGPHPGLGQHARRGEALGYRHRPGVRSCGSGPGRFHALAFAPDGRTLALAEWQSNEGDILLWDLEANRLRSRLAGHTDGIGQLAFSRDGRLLVSGSRDKKIMFWDPEAAAMLGVIRDAGGMVNALALTPDGTQLAFVTGDETVRLRDLADLVPPRIHPIDDYTCGVMIDSIPKSCASRRATERPESSVAVAAGPGKSARHVSTRAAMSRRECPCRRK